MKEQSPHVAIAILNYNGVHHLKNYLHFINNCSYQNKSIWVIDNASSDSSIDFLKVNYPQIKVIQNGGNYGFAEGYNRGLKHVNADYYLIVNSDVEVTKNFLQPLVDMLQENKKNGIVQPKIISIKEPTKFEYAGASGGYIDVLGYPFCRGRIFEILEIDKGQYNNNTECFWASGACMLIKSELFNSLNGFYNYFYMHNEEIDLCWRAQNIGYKVLVCPKSQVLHLGGGSLDMENPKKVYYNFRNNLVMITRNAGIFNLFFILPVRFFLDAIVSIKYLFDNPAKSKALLKGWAHFIKWIFTLNSKQFIQKKGFANCKGVFKGSIVFNKFVLGKTLFSKLKF